MAVLYFAGLLAAAASSTPRRVGDGGEYFAMALQLAAGKPPSFSADELSAIKQRFAEYGAGFDSALLEYPNLIAADGRQDFLHYFLYPLIVAPFIPLATAVGLHANWAFTIVNALLLASVLFLVLRHTPVVACIAGFVGPIVWWVDKAHTEAFLFAAVSAAALLFRPWGAFAVLAYALAGAQNAAIGVTYPVFVALLWAATRRDTFTRRTWIVAIAGAFVVASPFLYTFVRLGRLAPMAEYAQRSVPSLAGVAAFVVEPNIGVVPNAPVFVVSLVAAVWLAIARRGTAPTAALWWWPVVIQLLLLAAWSQNPNVNHGGTPGMNRWVLSLIALSLPWIADAYHHLTHAHRRVLGVIVTILAVASAVVHLPARPESYRTPTRLATMMWTQGWMHVTPAEVFAERAQGREPAFVPSHDGECHVLLIANQQAPVECAPPVEPLPAGCRRAGAMCYGVRDEIGTHYVTAANNGFYFNSAEPAWPAGGPLATGIHRTLRAADPHARRWRLEPVTPWRDRLAGASIGVVLSSPQAVVIHVTHANGAAMDDMRQLAGASVYSLIPFAIAGRTSLPMTNLAVVIRR